jgi:hypothetical protein
VQKFERPGAQLAQIIRGGAVQPAGERPDRVYGAAPVGYIRTGRTVGLFHFHSVFAQENLYAVVLNPGPGRNAEFDATLDASRFALHFRYQCVNVFDIQLKKPFSRATVPTREPDYGQQVTFAANVVVLSDFKIRNRRISNSEFRTPK